MKRTKSLPDCRQSPPVKGGHLIICLSTVFATAGTIRRAARLAAANAAALTVIFILPGTPTERAEEIPVRIRKKIALAQACGAKTITVSGSDICAQIAAYAENFAVTGVILFYPHGIFLGLSRPFPLEEELLSLLPGLAVYKIKRRKSLSSGGKHARNSGSGVAYSLLITVGILGFFTFVGYLFYHLHFGETSVVILYVLSILLISLMTTGPIYGIGASFFSVLLFIFLFTEPRFTLRFNDLEYLVTFLVLLTAAIITSTLTMRSKNQALQATQKAWRTEILLETSQRLQTAKNEDEIIAQVARQMIKLLNRSVILYPAIGETLGEPVFFPKDGTENDITPYLDPLEKKAAQWVCENRRRAGATTKTYPEAKLLYFAIRSNQTVFAVAGIVMEEEPPDLFEMNLFVAMLGECALALEKEHLMATKNRISIKAQQEQLRADLLRSISHDLRTPLTTISGNAAILINNGDTLSGEKKRALYLDIYDESAWLINLVENLLAITRFENGSIDLDLKPELIDEVVREALLHISRESVNYKISVSLEDEFMMARMDSHLIVQVITNLVNNAIRYTKPGSLIAIDITRKESMLVVEVADNGDGISDDIKNNLFEMFFTIHSQKDHRRGMGLGLALCKSIVTAHGGSIYVRDNEPHGAIFGFTLQAIEVKKDDENENSYRGG